MVDRRPRASVRSIVRVVSIEDEVFHEEKVPEVAMTLIADWYRDKRSSIAPPTQIQALTDTFVQMVGDVNFKLGLGHEVQRITVGEPPSLTVEHGLGKWGADGSLMLTGDYSSSRPAAFDVFDFGVRRASRAT